MVISRRLAQAQTARRRRREGRCARRRERKGHPHPARAARHAASAPCASAASWRGGGPSVLPRQCTKYLHLLCMVFPWCSDGAAAFTVVKSGSEHHETPYIILVRPLVNRQWQASWRRGRRLRLAGRQRRHSAATAPRVLSLGCPRRRRCGRLRSANRRRRPLARQAGAAAGMGTAGPGRALQCRQQPGEMLRRASAGDSGYDDRSSLNHEQNSAMHRPRMTVIRHHPPLPPLRSTERAPGPPFDFTFMLQRYRAQRGGFWILPAPAAAALDDLEQSAFGALPGRRSRR